MPVKPRSACSKCQEVVKALRMEAIGAVARVVVPNGHPLVVDLDRLENLPVVSCPGCGRRITAKTKTPG